MLILYKIIKGFLWAFVGLSLAAIIFSFFLPTSATVERTILINAKFDRVESYVSNLRTWEEWTSLKQVDSTMKVIYSAQTTGTGANAIYKGKTSGELKIIITHSYAGTGFEFEISQEKKTQKVIGKFEYKDKSNVTELKKTYIMELGWNPISKLFGLIIDKPIGEGLDIELKAIKKNLENNITRL